MAHQIEQMAYVGAAPWHGLGNNLSPKQPLEVWQREAGMDWQIQESPVHFKADTIGALGTIHLGHEIFTILAQRCVFGGDIERVEQLLHGVGSSASSFCSMRPRQARTGRATVSGRQSSIKEQARQRSRRVVGGGVNRRGC